MMGERCGGGQKTERGGGGGIQNKKDKREIKREGDKECKRERHVEKGMEGRGE